MPIGALSRWARQQATGLPPHRGAVSSDCRARVSLGGPGIMAAPAIDRRASPVPKRVGDERNPTDSAVVPNRLLPACSGDRGFVRPSLGMAMLDFERCWHSTDVGLFSRNDPPYHERSDPWHVRMAPEPARTHLLRETLSCGPHKGAAGASPQASIAASWDASGRVQGLRPPRPHSCGSNWNRRVAHRTPRARKVLH